MKELKYRVTTEDVKMANGEVLTEADFERMATEAETAEINVERLLDRQRRSVGRPALGKGISPIVQVRLDEALRRKVADRAEREHTTTSNVIRDAIRAWMQAS